MSELIFYVDIDVSTLCVNWLTTMHRRVMRRPSASASLPRCLLHSTT